MQVRCIRLHVAEFLGSVFSSVVPGKHIKRPHMKSGIMQFSLLQKYNDTFCGATRILPFRIELNIF